MLEYQYGVNQRVSPTVDVRDGGPVEVALHVEDGDGPAPAIALNGSARFQLFEGGREVRYDDGPELRCPDVAPMQG